MMLSRVKKLLSSTAISIAMACAPLGAFARDQSGMFDITALSGFMAFGDGTVGTPSPGGTSIIQSIQPFEITIGTGSASNTATITSVNTANHVIFWAHENTNETATGNTALARVALTDATTVTATRNTSDATDTVTVRGTVVEFVSSAISSIQSGTITITNTNSSNTATISAVTTSRSVVFYLGATYSSTTGAPSNTWGSLDLTNSTTVTARRGGSSQSLTIGYAVVEFASGITQSVQQRSVTLSSTSASDTDTISSVTTANTILIPNGHSSVLTSYSNAMYRFTLTNSTTVTMTRNGTSSTSRTIRYTVLEFASGIIASKQSGTTALTGATSADTTITSVDTTKALLNWCGQITNVATNLNELQSTVKLLDATTVRAEKNSSSSNATVGWDVIEFV